ncbi:MAG TPA: murein L,D-transpeptidase catalytic domain family protein [Chitinophagaceae bacterium]|nr:murein L,D-transpeptidase catalytic domain family protein [Chitinophagaceae bacterium]
MTKILKSISTSWLSVSLAAFPLLHTGIELPETKIDHTKALPAVSLNIAEPNSVATLHKLSELYTAIHLENYGLSKNAFDYALKGYNYLLEKNKIKNEDYLTICDFSQSSRNKRLYVIDLKNGRLLINTYVAHGRNSGGEFATRFSNRPESLESSLGFYVTENTYFGEHGLSLKIRGVDKGFNDRAASRMIVLHGATYAESNFLSHNQFLGRSFGCPAVPANESTSIINIIKNGTCFFIYHPTAKYLNGSSILNG